MNKYHIDHPKSVHPNASLRKYYCWETILRPFVGERIIEGWEFVYEDMVGSFSFEKEFKNGVIVVVYCTPYWEGDDGISFQVARFNSTDDQFSSNSVFELPSPSGESEKDAEIYFNIIKRKMRQLKLIK